MTREPHGTTSDRSSPQSGTEKGAVTSPGTGGDKNLSIPPGIAAGIALVVAALAAVGLSGNALTRSVRNFPWWISGIICVVLLSSLAIALFSGMSKSRGIRIATIVTVFAVCGAVILGAVSVHEREQPSVSLAAEYASDGMVTVTVSVAGAGLASQDQLAIQILGLHSFTRLDKTSVSVCEQSYTWSQTDNRGVELDTYLSQQGLSPDYAALLAWNRIGPDSNGAIGINYKLDLRAGTYGGVCAFSPLPSDPGEALSKSVAYLSLADTTQ